VTAIELRPEGTAHTARLFELHAPRVLAYCLRRLGSRSEAEDAVQTVFLYAHRALGQGVVPESEEAWLFAIARNVCRWQRRTASRRGAIGDVDLDAFPSQQADHDSEEIQRDLDAALASVPDRQRAALVLREWRGLSCPEIAEVLELSRPATHALLTRARRSVTRALSAAGRRPVLGLDLGSLLTQLRGLLAGSAAKAVVVTVAAAGAGVGGYAVEHGVRGHEPRPPLPGMLSVSSVASSPRGSLASAPRAAARGRARNIGPSARASYAVLERRAQAPSVPREKNASGSAGVPVPAEAPTDDDTPAPTQSAISTPSTTQPSAVGLPSPLDIAVPVPSVPDPTTPEATVPSVTVGEVTTPEATVPSVTVPVSEVTDPVTDLLP
jgi:RNA polymerase sigma-70 factor (ECF subfamily)